jgi:hypothetical protein
VELRNTTEHLRRGSKKQFLRLRIPKHAQRRHEHKHAYQHHNHHFWFRHRDEEEQHNWDGEEGEAEEDDEGFDDCAEQARGVAVERRVLVLVSIAEEFLFLCFFQQMFCSRMNL